MSPTDLTTAESEIADLWNAGEISSLTHLSGSTDGSYEQWLCDFFHANIKPTDYVFASHRCHFHYLLHGGADLAGRVRDGKSMFLYGERFVCSAIVAGTACIAAGVALSIKRRNGEERVFCFVGDGASEQGHFFEAVKFVGDRDLPCVFVIEDNDSSCGVTHEQRGSKPWQWPGCVVRVRYTPKYPHAGTSTRPILKRQTK